MHKEVNLAEHSIISCFVYIISMVQPTMLRSNPFHSWFLQDDMHCIV